MMTYADGSASAVACGPQAAQVRELVDLYEALKQRSAAIRKFP